MKYSALTFFAAFLCGFATSVNGQEYLTLEQAIDLALQKNYDISLAKNAAEASTTDKDYAYGAFLPQLNGVGSTTWNSNDQDFEFADETRNVSGSAQSNNVSASVQLSWLLFDGTRMFASLDRIKQISEQGDLLLKNQVVNTIADVIVNYHSIVREKQQLKAIQEQMGVSEERVKLAARKLDVGTGGKPELLQARVDLNAQRTQVITQQATILALKEQLNALLGAELPSQYEVADTIIINLDIKPDEVSENIEQKNFGLRASLLNLDIARLSLRERQAERLPFIYFNAAYNYSHTDNQKLVNPFSALVSQNQGYNYGFSINVPILNGLNQKRLVEQAKLTYSRQEVLYTQAKTNVDVGVRNAFVSYENAKKVLEIEEETILLAKENVFIALEGFKRGIITTIELRDAQQSLEDAYNRLIAARYLAKVAETELLRLSGALLQ